MFEIIKNAWRVPELKKKLLYTIMMIFIFRLGCFVPIPGVNVEAIRTAVSNTDILGLLDVLTGGSLQNFTLFAMGVTPYITAQIIIQLLTVAIPKLEEMQKEGEEGRKKIAKMTRYGAVGLAFVQSVGIIYSMGASALNTAVMPAWIAYIIVGIAMMAGSSFTIWIGDKITEKGVGNGISMLIYTGIVSRLLPSIISMVQSAVNNPSSVWTIPVVLSLAVLIITGVVFIDMGVRRVPVQYAKRQQGRRVYGGQSTHIPMKVNASGVLPLIFASSLVTFPQLIASFWPNSAFYLWYTTYMGVGTWVYAVIYALLIMFFTYFYTTISFNPIEISKNLQQYGGFIPGIRPGRPTSDYLSRISTRLTLVGAIFLALMAAFPQAFTGVARAMAATESLGKVVAIFGATSIMISVSVALETVKQLESQLLMRNYKGFLK